MKNLRCGITRGLLTLAAAGLGLTLSPGTARAEIVVFQVDETVVAETGPFCGVNDCTFDADKISGFYKEVLTINGDFSFDASARALLDSYSLAGGPTGTGAIGCADNDNIFTDHCYSVYALFQGSGNVNPVTGIITFTSADIQVGLDADGSNTYTPPATGASPWTAVDTTGDDVDLILGADLIEGSGNLTPPTGGFFDLTFGNLDFAAFAALYWPGLERFGLTSVVDGDFDSVPAPPIPGTYSNIQGEVSAVFAVPEPASLVLLGMGLLGSAVAVRRRRTV